jgi:transketolase
MNVNLVGVGAGFSYVVSGPTHQCYEDLTIMRAMPNMQILSPADHVTSAALLSTCRENLGPKYLRFDAQPLPVVYDTAPDLAKGFHIHRQGGPVCLIATGYMLHTAMKVAAKLETEGHSVGLIDLFNITGFSQADLARTFSHYSGIVSLEEGFRGRGGVDAMLFDFLAQQNLSIPLLNLGVEGSYQFELGSRAELHEKTGIGADIVTERVRHFIQTRPAAASAA